MEDVDNTKCIPSSKDGSHNLVIKITTGGTITLPHKVMKCFLNNYPISQSLPSWAIKIMVITLFLRKIVRKAHHGA